MRLSTCGFQRSAVTIAPCRSLAPAGSFHPGTSFPAVSEPKTMVEQLVRAAGSSCQESEMVVVNELKHPAILNGRVRIAPAIT